MARLRFVGRSGQKFNRSDLLGKARKKNVTENNKLDLLTKIHTGLKEFTHIAGTDSDEEESFLGFKKQDIREALQRSEILLAKEIKEPEEADEVPENPHSVKKGRRTSKGKIPAKEKIAERNDPSEDLKESTFLSGQVEDSDIKSQKRSTLKGEKKESLSLKTPRFGSSNTTANKSMKGTIKIKFSGPGFYRQLTKGNFKKSKSRKDDENDDDAEKTSEADDEILSSPESSKKRKRGFKSKGNKSLHKDRKSTDSLSRKSYGSGSNIIPTIASSTRNDVDTFKGSSKDDLKKNLHPNIGEAMEKNDYDEERFAVKKGRKKHILSGHGDGLYSSNLEGSVGPSNDSMARSFHAPPSGLQPMDNSTGAEETPLAKKVPSLEAPLICSTKRQPKPNLKFLAYSTNEEEATPSGRQRRKSQGTSEHADRSPGCAALPARARDSKSALNAKNSDLNAQPVVPVPDKKEKCCICGNVKTSQKRLKDCQHWCCVDCTDFYIDHAQKFTKYKLNVACKFEPENCNMDSYRSKNQCPSCRFKKCLMLLPSPTQVVAILRKEAREGLINQCAAVDNSKDEGQSDSLKGINIVTSCEGEYLEQVTESNPVEFISKSDVSRFKARFGLSLPAAEKPVAEQAPASEEPRRGGDVAEAESSVKEDKLVIDEDVDVETTKGDPISPAPQQLSRGPRIKHVCREASIALGKTPAVFGGSNLRLSALPSFEKEKILRSEDGKEIPDAEESKKEKGKEEEDAENDAGAVMDKKDRDFMPKRPSKSSSMKSRGPFHKRSVRCGKCDSCKRDNCGKCKNCRDMPKFGGKGQIKQACEFRTCENPVPPLSHRKRSDGKSSYKDISAEGADLYLGSRKKTVKSYKDMSLDSTPDPVRSSSRKPGMSRIEMLNKLEADRSLMSVSHSHKSSNGSYLPATTCSVTTVLALESAIKLPENKDENYLEFAWSRGVSLVSMGLMSSRQCCKLCGSLGNSKMIYCNVCCEPFHEICMDERERPKSNKMDTWCCLQCQFCRVCFGQKDLLQCDLCQDSYHAYCLSDNHPTKPSKKRKIWVCSKCVKCKSCGATTPGDGKDCAWSHDFSLCSACGDMMDRGNFCPVCQKCYQEDDWDSQMIQCSVCTCWVHSRCEELSDEMYEIVANMPEDVPFTCRVCRPSPESGEAAMTPWKKMISNELNKGLQNAIDAAQNSCGYGVIQSLDQFQLALKHRKPPKGKQSASSPATTLSTTSIVKTNDTVAKGSVTDVKNASFNEEIDVCGEDEDDEEEEGSRTRNDLSASSSGYNILQVADPEATPGVPAVVPAALRGAEEEEDEDSEDINSLDFIKSIVSYDDKNVQNVPTSLSSITAAQGLTGSASNTSEVGGDEGSTSMSFCLSATGAVVQQESSPGNGGVMPSASLTDGATKPHDFLDGREKSQSEEVAGDGSNDCGDEEEDEDDDPIVGLEVVREKIDKLEYNSVTEMTNDLEQSLEGMMQSLNCDPVASERIQKSIKEAFYKQLSMSFPWYKPNLDGSSSEKLTHTHDPEDTVPPPYEDHTYAVWKEKPVSPGPEQPGLFRKRNSTSSQSKTSEDAEKKVVRRKAEEERRAKLDRLDDTRCCVLCWTVGDSNDGDCGRLLYMGQNEWIHVNCALWSAEVYEEADGVLQKVHSAAARGRKLRCDACGKQGATVGCCQMDCNANFHFPCARKKHCAFVESKKVFCSSHVAFADARMISSFNVDRRVCLDFENNKFFRKQWIGSLNSSNICILVGAMTIESMGKLTSLSDSKYNLFPVDYCSSRLFWSTKDARKRTYYRFRVVEVQPKSSKFGHQYGSANNSNDFTIPHDPSDPSYDKNVSARFARDREEEYEFSDASTLSISDGTDEMEHLDDIDSEEEEQLQRFIKKQNTPKPVTDMMATMERGNSGVVETPAPTRRGRGRPPGQKRGQQVEAFSIKKSKTASLISKLRQQPSEDDSAKKKTPKPTKNQAVDRSSISWQSGQQIRELLVDGAQRGGAFDPSVDSGEFVDVEREDELDVLGNRFAENEQLSLVQIVNKLNKAAARSHQSRGNVPDQFFDTLDDQDWANVFSSASSSEKKPSFSPAAETSSGAQPTTDGANNFFLNDIQSILLMHQQQQQKETIQKTPARSSVIYVNQNVASAQGQHAPAQMRANISPAAGNPVQYVIGKNFVQQQGQQVVAISQSPQVQAVLARRPSALVPAAVAPNQSAENSTVRKLKLVLVTNVSSGRSEIKQIDQLDGQVDDSESGGSGKEDPMSDDSISVDEEEEEEEEMEERGEDEDEQVEVGGSHDQSSPVLKRKRLEDDEEDEELGVTQPTKKLHRDSSSNSCDDEERSHQEGEEGSRSAAGAEAAHVESSPSPRQELHSESQDSSLSLDSSEMNEEDEEEEDGEDGEEEVDQEMDEDEEEDEEEEEEEVDVEEDDDDEDAGIYGNRRSGPLPLNDEPSKSQPGVDDASCDEEEDNSEEEDDNDGDDEDEGGEEDSEQDTPKVDDDEEEEEQGKSSVDQTMESQSKNEPATTAANHSEGLAAPSSEEKRKSHKDRKFKLRPMVHTHLPRAEAEEEIENCTAGDEAFEEGAGIASASAHFDQKDPDKESKTPSEESPSRAAQEEEEASCTDKKKKEEMKAKLSARYVPHLMFEITSEDGFRVLSDSVNRAWKSVIEKVKEARANAAMKPVSYAGLTGLYLSGLEHPAFVYILEQMPECRNLKNYRFKFHKEQWLCNEEQLVENEHGCARCEPFTRTKHKNDMFSFLLSEFRRPPDVDTSQARPDENIATQRRNIEQPLTKRFKLMKANAKEVVGVYRSPIHGRGLFCKKDVEAGEMIIEYSGEVIRTSLTDKRERAYEARGIGCYMFRKDLDHVIDSTVMGNASRFINHSCEPNCYCRVIQVENRKRIVIFAQRNIRRGEELTYDYKFPIEEVKIPCSCGSRKCRKYLN